MFGGEDMPLGGSMEKPEVVKEVNFGMESARKMIEISSKIEEIAAEQYQGEGMPVGDYQGAIEAQVLIAIQFGMGLERRRRDAQKTS